MMVKKAVFQRGGGRLLTLPPVATKSSEKASWKIRSYGSDQLTSSFNPHLIDLRGGGSFKQRRQFAESSRVTKERERQGRELTSEVVIFLEIL
jgi:hypothetical protein